jgi:hypothetical protein
MRTGKDRERWLLGIAVSLLAHALLLWPHSDRLSVVPPAPTPIELEILQKEPSVEVGTPPQRPEPEPVADSTVGGQSDGGAPAAPRGDRPPTVVPEPMEPAGRASEDEPVVRREEDGVWREEALPKLDLVYRPKAPLEEVPSGEADDVSEGEREAASVGRRIEERLEGFFRDKRAEEHARSRAEPAIVELRRRLEQRFSVPMEVLEEAPKGQPNLGLGGSLRAYAVQAQRYGATGNPYEEGILAPGSPEALDTPASTQFRFSNADVSREPLVSSTTATVTTLVARIEVVRGEDGVEARVLEGSGVPRFDRLALEQVRRELERVKLPPEVRRMRWAFVSTLRVTPPGPTVGCSIDQAFVPQECFYPGSKHQRSRVHLEALYLD